MTSGWTAPNTPANTAIVTAASGRVIHGTSAPRRRPGRHRYLMVGPRWQCGGYGPRRGGAGAADEDEATVDAVVDRARPGRVRRRRAVHRRREGGGAEGRAGAVPRRQTPLGRNDFEGFVTQRIYALFAKTRGFDELAIDPLLLGVLDRCSGHYQLSGPVGIDIGPGESPQGLHRDDVVYPLPWPHQQVVLNTMWALDDFTEDNGATLIVPGQPPHVAGRRAARRREAIAGDDAGRAR